MGGEDKLAAILDGRTVLAWSLRAFQACDFIQEIILVTHSIKEVRKLSDHLIELESGHIVARGETEKLLPRPLGRYYVKQPQARS